MGQAKRRGTFEERRAAAIEEGRARRAEAVREERERPRRSLSPKAGQLVAAAMAMGSLGPWTPPREFSRRMR